MEKDEGRGVLFRTNHVVSDQLSHFNPPEENYPSTHKRYDRIAQMVEERYGSLRFQDLYRIMSDHTNEPNCICRHPKMCIRDRIGGMAVVGAAQNGYTLGISGAWYSIAGSFYFIAVSYTHLLGFAQGDITWDAATRSVTAAKDDTSITLTIDQKMCIRDRVRPGAGRPAPVRPHPRAEKGLSLIHI